MTIFVLDASYPSLDVALRLESSPYIFVADRPIDPPPGHRALQLDSSAPFFTQARELRRAWRAAGGRRSIVMIGPRARGGQFLRNLMLARLLSSNVVLYNGKQFVSVYRAWRSILRAAFMTLAEATALGLYLRWLDQRNRRRAPATEEEGQLYGCYTRPDGFSLPPDQVTRLPPGPSLYGRHNDSWYLPRFSHAPGRHAVTTTRHKLNHVTLHVEERGTTEVSSLHHVRKILDYPYLVGHRPIRRFCEVRTTNRVIQGVRGIDLLYFTSGYYHWIIEGIPRVLDVLDDDIDLERFPLCLPPLETYQREFLTLMGITSERHILSVGKGDWCHLDECIFPTAYFPFGVDCLEDPSGWPVAGLLHRIRDRVLERLPPPAQTGTRLYISRQQAAKRKFTAASEAALAEVLGAAGFHKVVLENLPWSEQVLLFAGADFIVAPHGAGLANLAFSRARALLEIHNPGETRPYFATIARELGMEYGYAIARLEGESPLFDNMTVDAPAIAKLVASIDTALADSAVSLRPQPGARAR